MQQANDQVELRVVTLRTQDIWEPRLIRKRVCQLCKQLIEAMGPIEATRLPAITPAPSYFRASAGRRPLCSGGEDELEKKGVAARWRVLIRRGTGMHASRSKAASS